MGRKAILLAVLLATTVAAAALVMVVRPAAQVTNPYAGWALTALLIMSWALVLISILRAKARKRRSS